MKISNAKRKLAETAVGAAVGAVIAGPVGAVAGGLVGSQVAAHTPHAESGIFPPNHGGDDPNDPIVHAGLQRILVPVDLSQPSLHALRFAADWAARFGSEVCLLYVMNPANAALSREQAPAELAKLGRETFSESTTVSTHVREGISYFQIATAARELRVDLVIVAPCGHAGASHELLDSTAERLVRHAPCPVLTLLRAR